ncbi:unnamed protein product [Heligmosomoides polygyrus]|uniref:HTH_48 domain-containing protein n=1 Tax=Heligmosomoides polygyrus TaxID=6339 RepID=A0A183FMW6_HELPZ|nr:unnamed protein product [Heligmosomoides polygyrus]
MSEKRQKRHARDSRLEQIVAPARRGHRLDCGMCMENGEARKVSKRLARDDQLRDQEATRRLSFWFSVVLDEREEGTPVLVRLAVTQYGIELLESLSV